MNLLDLSIHNKVVGILRDKLLVTESILQKDNWDIPITGKPFNLNAYHLIYLLLELEKSFDIRINEQLLDNYGFCSINKISEAIRCC